MDRYPIKHIYAEKSMHHFVNFFVCKQKNGYSGTMNRAYLYPFLASITWGMIYSLDQRILQRVSPALVIFINTGIVMVAFLPVVLFEKETMTQLLRVDKRSLFIIFVTAMLSIAANWFILKGIKDLDASMASMIEISYPIFVAIFSFLFFRTVLSPAIILGGALILVGSMIVIRYGG
jgi:drug/metabolite transporter (DMT)-like permease